MASGYIEKYTNKPEFCQSYFLHPASWLISDKYVFAISILIIVYLLFGVAIAANFMARGID